MVGIKGTHITFVPCETDLYLHIVPLFFFRLRVWRLYLFIFKILGTKMYRYPLYPHMYHERYWTVPWKVLNSTMCDHCVYLLRYVMCISIFLYPREQYRTLISKTATVCYRWVNKPSANWLGERKRHTVLIGTLLCWLGYFIFCYGLINYNAWRV